MREHLGFLAGMVVMMVLNEINYQRDKAIRKQMEEKKWKEVDELLNKHSGVLRRN